MDSAGKMLAIQSLCDFMATVLQIKGSHTYIPMAVSTIPGLTPEMEHPVVHFWREMNEGKTTSPFSRIQAMYSSHGRQMIWISLQACGMALDLRLGEVISILRIGEQSTPQFFDALADAVIFTRYLNLLGSSTARFTLGFNSEVFGNQLRNLAINCLLDHCVKSRQWDILHQVFSFDPQIERLMFTTLRDKLSQYACVVSVWQ
jgi:hypothetical protein